MFTTSEGAANFLEKYGYYYISEEEYGGAFVYYFLELPGHSTSFLFPGFEALIIATEAGYDFLI